MMGKVRYRHVGPILILTQFLVIRSKKNLDVCTCKDSLSLKKRNEKLLDVIVISGEWSDSSVTRVASLIHSFILKMQRKFVLVSNEWRINKKEPTTV